MLAPRRRRPPPAPSAQTYHVPAPVGGLNTVSAGTAMPATDCVLAYNVIPAESGLRGRLGWEEWCTGLEGVTTDAVRTVLPFNGSAVGNAKLFATTEQGIYDVSSSTTTPTLVYTFATQTGNAGYGVSTVMVTAAGHFLLYSDEVNGLHIYSESGASWAAVTQGSGATQIDNVNPARLAFVAVWKARVWFVERETAKAWYLPAGQIYGAASSFNMGTAFRAGGTLVGLWNWTIDGGSGIDDALVAASSGGDVLVFKGTDPSSSSAFGLQGVWQVGELPAGRRVASNYGGDLLLLARDGLVPMSRLVVGGSGPQDYATAKVGNLVNALMLEKASSRDWGIVLNPEDANSLMLLVPQESDPEPTQLVQSTTSRGWFRYRGLPIFSAAPWEGTLYFGTNDGRVCRHTGYVDGVTLADPTGYEPVDCSILGAYSDLGRPAQKQVTQARPLLVSDSPQSAATAQARYKYSLTEADEPTITLGGAGTWDSAIWDTDVWGGSYTPSLETQGGAGCGVHVAIAVRFASYGRTVYVGCDVAFLAGGWL